MGQIWDDILQEGSFDGVKFDFVSVRNGYSNDIDNQKFPGRKGTKRVGKGRNGATWEILAIIIEDDYPQKMKDLTLALDNGGEAKWFVHPIDGSTLAVCERFTVNHDAEDARDSCTIQISLSEQLIDDLEIIVSSGTTAGRANAVRSLATQVLQALSAFEAATEVQNSPIGLAVIGAVNAANGIADELEATGDDLSAIAIQATANGGLSAIDAAVSLISDFATEEQYDLSAALLSMASSMRDLAQNLIEKKPPLAFYKVPADTNLLALAHAISADAEELLALNSFADPSLIPAGTTFIAYTSDSIDLEVSSAGAISIGFAGGAVSPVLPPGDDDDWWFVI
jgi:prophage DNA circulation protein